MTIVVVQTANGDQATPPVFGAAVTRGNTVFAVIGFYTALPQTVTGIELGTFTIPGTVQLEFPQTAGAGSPQGLLIAMLPNVQVSGQTAVNYTTSSSTVAMEIFEVAGLGPSPALDQSVAASGSTGTIITGNTGLTRYGPEFVLCGAATYNGSTNAPSQSGWTTSIGLQGHLSTGYQTQATASQSYAWTQVCGGAIGWAAAIVTIRGTSGLYMIGIA